MREKFEILILKLYEILPGIIRANKGINDYVVQIAEKRLMKVKQDIIKINWEKVQLEKDLQQIKANK